MEHITQEAVLSLNNGSVTFEEARARFNVDLWAFKARLEQLDIFVWKEVNGALVRIHGDNYKLKVLFRDLGKCFAVKGTKSFEDVIRMLEKQLNLSPGCYKLTYKHPKRSIGIVWVKTDRDWHNAVLLSMDRGYFVLLDLEVFPSSQTADEDACDEDACDEDACDEDACDEDACDEDACDEDAYDEDAYDEDAYDEDEDYTDDDFCWEDVDEDDYADLVFVEDPFDEDACDDVDVHVPMNSVEHITEEKINSLNNGSVSFEEACALFKVDLSTFKARLEQLNIFVWKEIYGESVRIHGGHYQIKIVLKGMGLVFVVHGTETFKDVISMLETSLPLGRYNLSYKDPDRSVGKVCLKTDRDWHNAVSISRRRGYYVLLYLEMFGSSQTADEDACDEPMCEIESRFEQVTIC